MLHNQDKLVDDGRKRPNILYVFADQWRRHATGFHGAGGDPVRTPHMDRFAAESLVFDHALSCTPLCSPHRAALMTGRYPLTTGVYTNCKLGTDVQLSGDEIGIGDALSEAGYATGYIGKWHLDLPEQCTTPEPVSGAREWDAYTPPGPKRQGFQFWYSYGAYDHHLLPHYWRDTPEMIQVEQWSPEHETDVAIDWLRGQDGDQPFALFVSWNPPHSPFELVPERYRQMYADGPLPVPDNVRADTLMAHTGEQIAGGMDNWERYRRDYYAAVSGIDEQFGRLLDTLEELGYAQDTIVVLTSDHGELMGAHGLMAKHSWHEESVGVPFVVRWPEHVPAGERTDALLNTVDIMPTLLSLADVPVPGTVQGSDISAVMRGESRAEAACPQSALLSAFPGRLPAIQAFAAAGLDNKRFGWRGVRTKRHTYVVHRGYAPGDPVERLLYDLEADPYQLSPERIERPQDHPVAAALHADLQEWLRRTDDAFDCD